ncbi:HXXEE domain-containing protein [Ensifer adhaerens]|uniref:HXXEE domain-containing protein n=1 Tax=Ensifer adhaerens TaxID=106592 RepID=UPI003CFD313A
MSAVIGVGALAVMAVFWEDFSVLQRFALANFAVIMFHVFEEFGVPGGFGKLANTLLYTNSPDITRWPLNQKAVMIGNWAFAVLFYLPPIFFPNVIWLGITPMLFGAVGQMLAHGVINNLKLKAAGLRYGYNSGLVTAALGHVPLCIGFGYYLTTHNLATGWDWAIGFAYAVFAYVVVFRMVIMKSQEDPQSPYPFDATEMRRFDKLYQR